MEEFTKGNGKMEFRKGEADIKIRREIGKMGFGIMVKRLPDIGSKFQSVPKSEVFVIL